jgi:phosphoribosylanthranilate isomerase
MLVKAGAIQNLTDARYFASRLVNWVGFCFDPESPLFIHPREAQQIINWLEGPIIVGEFGNRPVREIQETALILGLQAVQVDATSITNEYQHIEQPLIARVVIDQPTSFDDVEALLAPHKNLVDKVLVDLTQHFDSWEHFVEHSKLAIEGLQQLVDNHLVILATQFNANNIGNIVYLINPAGIQMTGSTEEKTGEKSFDEQEAMFEALEYEL